jgi:acyl-CoA reductase-like NAD-dependent aldehyde dehydrogenase
LLHKRAFMEFHPLGVIGVICPWNYPLQNVLGPTIPALFAGNAVVVKVSEWTSYSAPRFQAIFDEVLGKLGHSPDLVQVITGDGETGAALCRAGVDKIVFTGSMNNGQRVAAQAAESLTPVILELGGKDAFVVCDDADLEQAAHAALAGCYISAGQACLAAERLYVMDGIHDRFVGRVVELVQQLRQGPPLGPDGLGTPFGQVDVGAMTMPAQVDIVEGLVNDAVKKGARVLVGGHRRTHAGSGQYFEPTVLCNVDHTMAIARQETFGPVMCILRVHSEEEAIRLANDTDYGLGSTVLTRDPARARRISQAIRAGSTSINDFGLPYMANALPFGGVGGSGYGRLNGREGLRAMCNTKSVLEDRLPFHQPVKLYPVRPMDFARNRAVIELLYRRGLVARAGAALELCRQTVEQVLSTLRGGR